MSNQKWKDKLKENHEKHGEEGSVSDVVNFEQEKKYFEANKNMLHNKIVSLQDELVEEKELGLLLENKDVKKEEELKEIRDFIDNNNQEVEGLFLYVCKLCDELKEIVIKNKQKQKEMEEDSEEYKKIFIETVPEKVFRQRICTTLFWIRKSLWEKQYNFSLIPIVFHSLFC